MIEALRQLIRSSGNIVFFGGAGVSTESGIPDFRSVDGLYQKKYAYPPETTLSHDFFTRHPEEFYAFYKDKMIYPAARPNAAHLALSRLEKDGRLKAVITQNIDGLHQSAGSRNVLELHGSVHRSYCVTCGTFHPLARVLEARDIPRCDCGGIIKPDVVLYGEPLRDDIMRSAIEYISQADMLIVGGTSLSVYPAAGLIDHYRGSKLVLINRTATNADGRAALCIREPIGETLDKAYPGLLN